MKSLLFQPGATVLENPPNCGPDRTEVRRTIRKNGRLYRIVLRDKVVIEDPYLVLVKAVAFAVAQGEPYSGQPTSRSIRDFLVKSNLVV